MTERSTTAAWMDRLSDAVGNYYPGGRWLGPRHPIKVTLLMGLLGLASGWTSMIAGVGIGYLILKPSFREEPIFLTAGLVLGIVVVSPWAAWLGARLRFLIPILAYVAAGNAIWYAVIEQFRPGHPVLALFSYGALTGGYVAVLGLTIMRSHRPMWLVLTTIICGASMCSFMLIEGQSPLRQLLPNQFRMPLIIAWFFTLLHVPTAICLGFPLWDWTQLERPKLDKDIGVSL